MESDSRVVCGLSAHEPQLAIAEFIATGACDLQLRRLRALARDNARRMMQRIQETFPADCRVTQPSGGYVLWIELPRKVDAVELFRRAQAKNIVIVPGPLSRCRIAIANFIRMSYTEAWSSAVEHAIATVGEPCERDVVSPSVDRHPSSQTGRRYQHDSDTSTNVRLRLGLLPALERPQVADSGRRGCPLAS